MKAAGSRPPSSFLQGERVCVFAGSDDGTHADYRAAAVSLGRHLAEHQITLVYGGAGVGLTGALADAFVALPGGLGTFEELLEAATWSQLGIHAKPCGVLNVRSYFDPFLAQLDKTVDESFLRPEHRRIILADRSPQGLLAQFSAWQPPPPKRSRRPHLTGRGEAEWLDARSRAFLIELFTGLRDDLGEQMREPGAHHRLDLVQVSSELVIYEPLLNALEGREAFPDDERVRKAVAGMAATADRGNEYERVVLEHRAFAELSAALGSGDVARSGQSESTGIGPDN